MADASQVIALVVAGILGGVSLWWSRRKLRQAAVAVVQPEIIVNLRAVADSWEDRYDSVLLDLAAERLAHAVTKAALEDEQSAGARCRRELAGALADLRGIDEIGRAGRTDRQPKGDA